MYKLIQLNDPVTISDKRMPSNCPEGVPVFYDIFSIVYCQLLLLLGYALGYFRKYVTVT